MLLFAQYNLLPGHFNGEHNLPRLLRAVCDIDFAWFYSVKRLVSAEQMLVLKKAGQLPYCYRWAVRAPFAAAALHRFNNRARNLVARGGR